MTELYDRQRDPFEITNRAGEPAYARVQRELSQRVHALRTCTGAGYNLTFGPVPSPVRDPDPISRR